MTQEAPIALIQQARASILSKEEQHQQQLQSDAICVQTRLVAEELLQGNGALSRSIEKRLALGVIAATVIASPFLAVYEAYTLKKYGHHSWEEDEQLEWRTKVNGSEPVVAVWLSTDGSGTGGDSKRAHSIDVRVQGLAQSVSLYRDYAQIHNPGFYDRRPNLEEAQKWSQLVESLRNP